MLLLCILIITSCSTPPKNPGNIYDIRRQAEQQLSQGNKQADRGNPENALKELNEAMRLAVITDDQSLRIRCRLSRGNVLFLLGRSDEAFADWNDALAEAEQLANNTLSAVSRIHIERGKLLSPDGKSSAQQVRDAVTRDLGAIKSERFYTAFAWMVIAQAEKELGRYSNAEAAIRHSLEIHEKDSFFELAAYDWFMIASCRSLAADFRGAQQALENAIDFDRRVENSWGLASDWRALGDVYTKSNDLNSARAAYNRSAEIFRALGNEAAAAAVLSKLEN